MSVTSHRGTPRVRPGRALLLLAAGLVLVVSFGVVACRAEPGADFGRAQVTTLASAPASAAGGVSTAGSVPIQDGRPPTAGAEPDAPERLRVPGLGLDAAVDAVGIEPKTGDFAVPPSVDRVGWYQFGPGFSATAGSIVVAGHVDSAAEGKGAFFRLGSLAEGALITLVGDGGRERKFTVTARERYPKSSIPLAKYFARDGRVRLTLITCGGPFDRKTGHYRDNVVVTATPR